MAINTEKSQLLIGIMSGTSLDGVDAALVAFENGNCQLQDTQFLAYPESLKTELLALHTPQHNELEAASVLGCRLAHLYADAVKQLLSKAKINAADISAIGCHGQTIRHRPELGFTLQIGNNALLAELTNISVIGDFRSRDIAAGGQGAPLVPAFHKAMFASTDKNRAIVNIGGIANITYLPKIGKVLGFDSGPGNMLLDSWTKLKNGEDYDKGGAWAGTGTVLQTLLSGMLAEPYFALPPPKSTGRDLFNDHWLKQHQLYPHLRPQDVARTLVALTAHSIHDALVMMDIDEVFACGGGAHNTLLIKELQTLLGDIPVSTTEALGVGVDWVEAVAFAWLAKQTLENKPSNLPEATGAAGARVLGAIYPA
ncbi:MAG TPA: anhydro-N-acetylmuramic acid kinase [Methylotenera sp.]|nr:anhydro-N-acetylmuramic acid kinase [Methylotenera sp.]